MTLSYTPENVKNQKSINYYSNQLSLITNERHFKIMAQYRSIN